MQKDNTPIDNNSKEPYKYYFLVKVNEKVSNNECENCKNSQPIGQFKKITFIGVDEQNEEISEIDYDDLDLCQNCYLELKSKENIPKFLKPLFKLRETNEPSNCIRWIKESNINLDKHLYALALKKEVLKNEESIDKLKNVSSKDLANLLVDFLTQYFGVNLLGDLFYIEGIEDEFHFMRNNTLIEANGIIKSLLYTLFGDFIGKKTIEELFPKLRPYADSITIDEYKERVNPIRYIKFRNCIFDSINFELIDNLAGYYFTYEIPWEIDLEYFDKLRKGLIGEDYFQNCKFYELRRFYDDENWNKLVLALGSIICYGKNERRRLFLIIGEKNTGKSTLKALIEKTLDEFTHEISWNDFDKHNRFNFSFLAYGKRVGLISEKPDKAITNSERLKAVLGDRKIAIEQKYKNPIEVETRLRIIAFCNDIPLIKEIDDALLQRIIVIFTQSPLQEEEIDPNFEEELMKEENIRDFLKFVLYCGYKYWLRGKVLVEDNEHLKELLIESKDFTIPFIKECCEEGEGFKEKREDLYNAFKMFRKENGLELNISNREFYAKLRMKYEETIKDGYYYFKGIRLKEEYRKQDTLA